jgi:nucleoside-diphosphate-sugar epimerase
MNKKLPGIVLTGASGFVGRNFIDTAKDSFRLFCIARRSQSEAGIPGYENVKWAQADIGNAAKIQAIAESIKKMEGADYVLHLAGFYDFTLKDNTEYENTNINGTLNILNLAKSLKTKHFIFSSSLVVNDFSEAGTVLDEKSPPDAEFPYAKSKRIGEEYVKEYSKYFPCSIIRLAAVFSDWCEYAPLYVFLSTWLSRKWNSRIIAGKGDTSITYIHIHDLIKLIIRILEINEKLPGMNLFVASPPGSVSHNDLYTAATKYYYEQSKKPVRIPKWFTVIGVVIRHYLGQIFGNEPFECPWMIKYVDTKLVVEPSVTNKILSWKTTRRYDILRRMLFMVDKIKNYQNDWKIKNEITLRRIACRPNIITFDILINLQESIVNKMLQHIMSPENKFYFRHYQEMEEKTLKWFISFLYKLIAVTIRTKNRQLIQDYVKIITYHRFLEGFKVEELLEFLNIFFTIISNALSARLENQQMKQEMITYMNIIIQMTADEVEDYYEYLETQPSDIFPEAKELPSLDESEDIKRIQRQLEDTFFYSMDYVIKSTYPGMIE